MGKNFSCNNLGQRKKSDFYETPYSMTEQLLREYIFPEPILEPAKGNGAIVKVLSDKGYLCEAYDVEVDFLKETGKFPSIITNPPYSLAYEFILKAKEVAQEFFAFLLPLSYLHGQKRYNTIWQDEEFPLSDVCVFTRYPMLGEPLREDGKYHTGMMVYAWFIWHKGHYGPPNINWIDNNSYVIGKGDE